MTTSPTRGPTRPGAGPMLIGWLASGTLISLVTALPSCWRANFHGWDKGSGGGLAAVHGDDLTRQEAGGVGCEERDDVRDLAGVAEAAGRDGRRHRGGALLAAGEAVQAAGGDRAGGDGVDADALGGHLERRGLGEAV